jgi:tetratricopeptide (TPR) repeat protein
MMSDLLRWRPAVAATLAFSALLTAPLARAQSPVDPTKGALSSLDAPLFYQILIGEIELRQGEPGAAFEVILDAARRTRDDALFRRAVDIALQGRAGDQALAATRAWRTARPESQDALRLQLQVLLALNRPTEIGEPLKALLNFTPAAERVAAIAVLPRFLQRSSDPKTVTLAIEEALKPYAADPATRNTVLVARARAWLNAGDVDRALTLAQEAQAQEPGALGAALVALDLMAQRPAAERIVADHLAQPGDKSALRLSYVRTLTAAQRFTDAVKQLDQVTRDQPTEALPYLTLGAIQLELKHPKEGEAALLRYIELSQNPPAGASVASRGDDDDDDDGAPRSDAGLVQAWLLLAQAAEQRGDFKGAETWLGKVEDPQRALEVQTRRATILARQGKLSQARELIRVTPERGPQDARAKLVAEAGVLREVKRWGDAFEVLSNATQRFADDADLLYEQAMMAEKLDRLDDMEQLLRRAIAIKPDNPHSHNALGYSLADRGLRLPEAKALIQRALELSPGDPFITDSLAWVEFRMGNANEALRLLRQAYAARPDIEIGTHLGEVLWALGQQDEARKVWRDVKTRDHTNEVLRETLARLRIDL